jgi:hypothetical protein
VLKQPVIKKLEAALQALTRAPVPARSAPLDSLTQIVKDIIPVQTQAQQARTPARCSQHASHGHQAWHGGSVCSSGGAACSCCAACASGRSYSSRHDRLGFADGKAVHSYSQTGCTLSTAKQPTNPQSSGGSKRVAWKLPAAATANAAVAVASALAILPTARAEFTGPVLDPSILLQDEGAVWAQIFAALLIWVVFRLGRYLAGASRRAMRFLNMTIFLISIAWVQQMLGLRAPVAALWQSAIAAGWAAPVFWSAVAAGALFVLAWFKTERALFRKALRL